MMLRLFRVAVVLTAAATTVPAQDPAERCLTPDTVVVRGAVRTTPASILSLAGIVPGKALGGYLQVQRAFQVLYATTEYDDIRFECVPREGRTELAITVVERPVLNAISVSGMNAVTRRMVEDRVELLLRRPVDPALVRRAITRIDSLYEATGYYLATIVPETTIVEPGRIDLEFRIDEGRKLAISGVRVSGTERISATDVVSAMKTRPEGFWWFQGGEYDEDTYEGDLGERLPLLFGKYGLIDFQVVRDTLVVDRERGKALVDLTVREGTQYRIGSFASSGNVHFTDEQLKTFYPFSTDVGPTLSERAINMLRGRRIDPTLFDYGKWDDATTELQTAYANEGYTRVRINPVMERSIGPDSQPIVNLRWEVSEGSPSIINRIDIVGNDYTVEHCVRDMLELVPGDVYSQARLIRSYQNLSNLGFFEAPIAEPEIQPINEAGDLNVTFKLKEKRTGLVNFGASMGQGYGLGGFLSLEQPNLFGRCKRGAMSWQFGKYVNDFSLSYTDPAIRRSRVTGTVTAYRSQARYRIADLGQTTRIGGSVRAGVPVRGSNYSRAFIGYTGEAVKYGREGLLGTVSDCKNCFRSSVGIDLTRDNRIGLPFPMGGALHTASAQFNGGLLGGSANFQRYTGETRNFVSLKQLGGKGGMGQPISVVLGLSARAGAVFGNTGPFFFSQRFAMGGVQFGEPLRGYPEFSVTPKGFLTGTSTYNAQRESYGSAFFASTIELGVRFNAQFYLNAFLDAGNVWERPREFDPTRLYRGSGIGLSTVTPLGPLGLDWAYGFDRLDAAGRRIVKPQLHFRLGQLF